MSAPFDSLSKSQLKAMLDLVADRIIVAEPELSQADRDLGDGDHGIGMARGMTAAKEALAALPDEPLIGESLTEMGKAMMASMGGASGVVFGTLFRAGGRSLKGEEGDFTAKELSVMLNEAAASVMKRGGAKAGDKTMLDALIPAGEKAKEVTDLPLHEALEATAQAAEDGRDASKDMIATMGRARSLGEKSLGFPDAGACSVAIVVRTMSDFVSGKA